MYVIMCALKSLEWLEMETPSVNANAGSGGNDDNGMMVSQSRTNDATGVDEQEQKQNLKQVIDSTEKTLALTHQLYLTVSSFSAGSQLPLLERL